MSLFEERKQRRIDGMRQRADSLSAQATAVYDDARKRAERIPFGQPIHVGHHSERADRSFRRKIDKSKRKAFALQAEAEELQRRADAAAKSSAVSSDDPNAIEKLRAKVREAEERIGKLEQIRDTIDAAKRGRRTGFGADVRAALMRLGMAENEAAVYAQLPHTARGGIENVRAEIRRLENRIDELTRQRAKPARSALRFGPALVSEDRELNRVQVRFDGGKPPDEVRAELRSRGFVWAPSQQAWQRRLTDGAFWRAQEALKSFYGPGMPDGAATSEAPPPRPASTPPAASTALKSTDHPGAGGAVQTEDDQVSTSAALQTWLEHPTKATRERFKRALERAEKSGKVAAVALGKRRLEIRKEGRAWTVVNPKSGEELAYSKREKRAPKVKVYNAETPRQFKARMRREADRDARKQQRQARKKEREELRETARETKKGRTARLKKVRSGCKSALQAARKTKKPSDRRVAVARARERCAATARSVEETFAKRLGRLERKVEELRETRNAKPRSAQPARSAARERLEERDQAVVDELERRGLGHLAPVWEREKHGPAFRSLPFDRAIERFLESLENETNAIAMQQELDEAAGELLAGEAACGEAAEYAAAGDEQARLWAEQHCEDGRPRRKSSAQSRTVSMFGDLAPPPDQAAARGRKPKRGVPPPQGQQAFGLGRFGASFVDTSSRQQTF